MSSLEAFVRQFLGKKWGAAEPQDDYVSIDSLGRARFDVASYLASEEGNRHVREIAEANRSPSHEDTTRRF